MNILSLIVWTVVREAKYPIVIVIVGIMLLSFITVMIECVR